MVGETFVSKSALTKRLKVGTRGHVAIARDARRARLGLTRPTGLLHRHYPQVPELQLQNATLISK